MSMQAPAAASARDAKLEQVARIVDPATWARFDRTVGPFVKDRPPVEKEILLVHFARAAGCKTADDVRTWLTKTEPVKGSLGWRLQTDVQASLAKAEAILAAVDGVVDAGTPDRPEGWLAKAMTPLLPLWGAPGNELPGSSVKGVPTPHNADPRLAVRQYAMTSDGPTDGNVTIGLMIENDRTGNAVWLDTDFTPEACVQIVASILSKPAVEPVVAPLLDALSARPHVASDHAEATT